MLPIIQNRGSMIEVHTGDIHFGAMDPKVQYDILMEQMIAKVKPLKYDAFFINGDLFHHKFMTNSDVVMHASMFVDAIVCDCRAKGATLVILHGTGSHDANQLKIFYHYIASDVDVRIVEHMQFENIKNSRVLCIPEEYGMGKEYYEQALKYSGLYDMAVLHGTIKGSIYGCNEEDLDSVKAPVFDMNSFNNCLGPVICSHVHIPGCYYNHIYYAGSPLRWQFAEEEEKGFLILLHDLDRRMYYLHLEEIQSFRYDTINLDDLISYDPKTIIDHITTLKNKGIDYIKVRFNETSESVRLVKEYYKNSFNVVIDAEDAQFKETLRKNQEANDQYKGYEYILDPNMSPYEIFTRYVNQEIGHQYITVEDLTKILTE